MSRLVWLLFIGFAVLIGLTACSSPPQKTYQVTRYKDLSHAYMAQGDRQRQLEQFDVALTRYQQAEYYAQKRNDKHLMGIAYLKRAAIHIKQDQIEQAQQLMRQVRQMSRYEEVNLLDALTFINAKLAYQQGDVTGAVTLLSQLEQAFSEQPEKRIYYRLVKWSYQPSSVATTVIAQDLTTLDGLVANHQLNNIEIYSFGLLHYLKWLSSQPPAINLQRVSPTYSEFEFTFNKTLSHFADLELSNNIGRCYQFAAQYYQRLGEPKKADYYQQQANQLKQR